MATIAEFSIQADGFPLGSVFDNHPGVAVELEQVVPTNNAIIPYFWITGIDKAEEKEIEAEFATRAVVQDVKQIDKVADRYLMRVKWDSGYDGILQAIAETDVVLISGEGTANEWVFEVRGDDQNAIAAFQEHCRKHDIPVTLTNLHSLSQVDIGTEHNLTETQREALILAYEQGYYRSPREVTLDEMAEGIGITGQSLGSRLRGGTHRLIGSTLISSE